METTLLEAAEKEWKDILKEFVTVAKPLGYGRINESNVEKVVIHVFANKYVTMLLEHANNFTTGDQTIPTSDILDFLCTEMVCGFLNISPTNLYEEKCFKEVVICDKAVYFQVYQCLRKNPKQQVVYTVSESVEKIEKVVSESCRWYLTS